VSGYILVFVRMLWTKLQEIYQVNQSLS